jgi:AAA domain
MSVIEIEDVKREGAKLLIILCGVSGGGKTYTALQVGLGLAGGDASKLGFLDTENGRGRLYADSMPAPYKYGLLHAPFSPERYIEAISDFEKSGASVLVIDSGSHEWEGIGGCVEIAEKANPRFPNWNKAKAEHKKLMSRLLSTPMHVLLCLRAREQAKPETQNGKTIYVNQGLQPITEKNVVFEATISLMLHNGGKTQDVIKCPAELMPIMGRGQGYITPEDGLALLEWVSGGAPLDKELWLLKTASEQGLQALQQAWNALPPAIRQRLGGCPEDLKASAKAFDKQRPEADKIRNLIGGTP